MPATTLVIDADGIAFKAAAAVQKAIRWDDDVYTLHADFTAAKDLFEEHIERLRSAVDDSANVALAYSCPSRRYFRHDLLDTYKGNRSGSQPPLCYRDLKEWTAEKYDTWTRPNLEADDVVGILATSKTLIKGEKIVVSQDKDLLQIPGIHLHPDRPSEGIYKITPEYAERQLWLQVLTGDSTDNYSGLPKCGPVTAEKILNTVTDDYAEVCLKAYQKAGLGAADMALMVNVARILTASSYDFKKKVPKLWQM